MSLTISDSIAELCQQEAGAYLRTVVHYENSDYEMLYLRDDVADEYTTSELTKYYDELSVEEEREKRQTDVLNVGNHHATLRMYDDALILHFPQGDDIGTVISFDPEAGRECSQFVVRCLSQLYATAEQDIPRSPDWDWL